MKMLGKALMYVVLVVLALWSLSRFRAAYSAGGSREAVLARAGSTGGADDGASNAAAAPDPAVATVATNGPGTVVDTATNAATAAAAVAVAGEAPEAPRPPAGGGRGAVVHLATFVCVILILAILAGWDITQMLAARATQTLGADGEVAPISDPEYEAAEQEWANGNHLDAIGMMRSYLGRNPSEQHVAIRIAEIYEKDLHNHLAAALELEEVLTRRLPREKWGWTAIHLANIYSGKLQQPDKALATLDRIVREYPETSAARKARQRLGIPEPQIPLEAPTGEPVQPEPVAEPEEDSNLPRGFRAKKR